MWRYENDNTKAVILHRSILKAAEKAAKLLCLKQQFCFLCTAV